ncbi:aminoacyl-tRNA hydrolase [Carnobacteriaceae bacterium zg-ZUI78]|uniref:aminoacyl-tRNA hydrolase n=1 Tax=Granulicatella sp. zg-84 TaxID=2678503 RepID=UPI0013C25C7B|nr:aminoacyl-tRNA hydrolase [Granulicatella sp. zg-84]MBS4750884.1 aminoacyl-tRNA hydrolase [Carnobacteriaceae bacterium zg-ZUI78]NEW65549.1 aminoacyl-tRNA hydrolase [Granulicatella sp. zg-84]QMI85569.1 aminoacyl-tRNA hydrolase [Carnobacteriaceae bacterium zg-84]
MTKMIIGLGNPGREYEGTKHNIGFMVLDKWAETERVTFHKTKHKALFTELFINGEKVILVKPQTYMNLSGQAVKPLMDYFQLDVEDIVVIYDDMDLPIGKIRLRQKGSAGGHNGIKSLISSLQTQEFNRVKVGIGRPLSFETVTQHVLSKFLGIYQTEVETSIDKTIQAMRHWIEKKSFVLTMNDFN